ncbi:MAG: hypothetical protein ABFS02_02870 [Pseudomonadota bacterium]
MKKSIKTPFAAAMGTAVVSTVAATGVNAEANPFAMTELDHGYMQVSEADKAKSGEMTCGAGMGKKEGTCGEGKCGNMMKETKVKEGKCASKKAKAPETAKDATKEGKCGEGKCGADKMDGSKMKDMKK